MLAVAPDDVIGSEDLDEMLIEVLGRGGDPPAQAREVAGFLVDQAIISRAALGREDLQEMIVQRLVFEFREATCAVGGSHVITLR
jgi:hypothetical protein